ncbi:hypothetical protein GPECTOR_30g225 [Gonium pectorale]|uniref:VWFA domain-containing protein n=1 Tax=Gonium pectorale TaxID=33097 RepID=A0A150GE67_GONPE|nr:hypothetical protein GPECTOR_30g225 [Gonium pectorale]|eukprot:KXZ48129.1 hypothetical protein GPECTOR_30g225 [Gonium pectorale]
MAPGQAIAMPAGGQAREPSADNADPESTAGASSAQCAAGAGAASSSSSSSPPATIDPAASSAPSSFDAFTDGLHGHNPKSDTKAHSGLTRSPSATAALNSAPQTRGWPPQQLPQQQRQAQGPWWRRLSLMGAGTGFGVLAPLGLGNRNGNHHLREVAVAGEARSLTLVRAIIYEAAKLPLHRRHELLDAVAAQLPELASLLTSPAAAAAAAAAASPGADAGEAGDASADKPPVADGGDASPGEGGEGAGAGAGLPDIGVAQTRLRALCKAVAAQSGSTAQRAPRPTPSAAGEALPAPEAQPAAQRADALTLSLVPEYDQYGVASGETLRAVVSIKAAPEASRRAHVALTCVLDRSGSMSGERIELVRDTAHFLVDQLTSDDYLGLVSYSSTVREDLPLMRMTPQAKALAHAVVEGLQASATTALYDGLAAGVRQQLEAEEELGAGGGGWMRRRGAQRQGGGGGQEGEGGAASAALVHSCFLFTDGQANVGPTTSEDILAGIRALQAPSGRVVTVHTFGFGAGHSVELLQALADAQSGVYYYIAGSEDIAGGFGDALGGLLAVVAKDIRLTVRPGPGTSLAAFRSGGRAIATASGTTRYLSGSSTGLHAAIRNQANQNNKANMNTDENKGCQDDGSSCAAGSAGAVPAGAAYNDMFAEETRECLVVLNLPAAAPASGATAEPTVAAAEVSEMELEYTDMTSGARVRRVATLRVTRSAEPRPVGQLPAELVFVTAARFETLDAIEKAQAAVADGNAGDADAVLDQQLGRLAAAPLQTAAVTALAEQTRMARESFRPKNMFCQTSKAAVAGTVQALRQQRVGTASEALAARHGALDATCKARYRQQATTAVSLSYLSKKKAMSLKKELQ